MGESNSSTSGGWSGSEPSSPGVLHCSASSSHHQSRAAKVGSLVPSQPEALSMKWKSVTYKIFESCSLRFSLLFQRQNSKWEFSMQCFTIITSVHWQARSTLYVFSFWTYSELREYSSKGCSENSFCDKKNWKQVFPIPISHIKVW